MDGADSQSAHHRTLIQHFRAEGSPRAGDRTVSETVGLTLVGSSGATIHGRRRQRVARWMVGRHGSSDAPWLVVVMVLGRLR
jgi:hypothetical protein